VIAKSSERGHDRPRTARQRRPQAVLIQKRSTQQWGQ